MNADVGEGFVFGIESDVKNFQTFAKTGTDYAIQYPDGAILEGNSDPSGTHYGVIVAITTAYDASLIGTTDTLIANSAIPTAAVADESGSGEIVVAGLATSSTGYFNGAARSYIFAYGGDGVNDFAQIYVNGIKDGEGTAARATFPLAIPKLTPINTQVLNGIAATVYLTEPISSYADLEAEVNKFKSGV